MQSFLTGFNHKLRFIRDYCGFNQKDLSEFMGISQPAYHRIECNSDLPRIKRIKQIADFYGITLADLIFKSEEEVIHLISNSKNQGSTLNK